MNGYWYQRTHEMLRAEGRASLVASLTDAAERLEELSRVLDGVVAAHMTRMGVSAEMLQNVANEVRRRPPDPPVGRRVPKTDERVDIVRAWLVGSVGDQRALVLHDRDGLAWQLCEVGLGWSFTSGPASGWEVFEDLQRLLPAGIVARPKGARAWDYKLHLSTGWLVVVRRGADKIMRFNVQKPRTA